MDEPDAWRDQLGEIRQSQTVKDLVAGSGFGFVDRGEHELKGVPGTWRVRPRRGLRGDERSHEDR